jgi:hypothetical protein
MRGASRKDIVMYRTNSAMRSKLLREGEPGHPGAGGGGATPPPAEEGLTEAGRAAIQREREAAKESGRARAAAVAQATELQKELDELKGATQSDLEKALAAAKKEARTEVLSAANGRLIKAEVKAAAAALGFHNPSDAAVQLRDSFGDVKVSDDGEVDEAAVKALIEQLAKDKPYLVKTENGRPQPLLGQGHHQQSPNAGRDQALEQARRRGFAKSD